MVDVSKDDLQWIRVIDYSFLKCYSTQQLYFPKQAVKYVLYLVANTQCFFRAFRGEISIV